MDKVIDVATARRDFDSVVNEARRENYSVIIKEKGKPLARLVPLEDESDESAENSDAGSFEKETKSSKEDAHLSDETKLSGEAIKYYDTVFKIMSLLGLIATLFAFFMIFKD